jgi:hypothetical protein
MQNYKGEKAPIAADGQLEITRFDLCATCWHCVVVTAPDHICVWGWPGFMDPDSYVIACGKYAD